MNAIISGRSGRALLIDGEALKSFEVDDPSTLTSRQQADLPYLFGEGADLHTLENTTIKDVEIELRNDCHFTWALDLTLIAMDAELPTNIRKEALDDLEALLVTNNTLVQVENILYARPLPEDADLKGSLDLCRSSASIVVQEFFLQLEECQPEISKICNAWESIPTKLFDNHEARETFRVVAVSEGYFRYLSKETSMFVTSFERDSDTSRIKELPNYKQVLQEWHKLSGKKLHKKVRVLKMATAGARLRPYGYGLPVSRPKRKLILAALRKAHGNYVLAANMLGISPTYLRKLLAKAKSEKSRYERPKLGL